jgi:citrate lyase subunit beta/citryl-CoA lyase
MIQRPTPKKVRLRRTMMFMNAQKPSLIRDAYIYGSDSIILDLEDAVAENQKDSARFSLYHALKTIDYGNTEVIVRINGLDTAHWQEDIRVVVAGGADGIRIAKCESADDVKLVEEHVLRAEREFGVTEGRTLLMAALESPKGIMNAYEIVTASDRMFGCAISGGDFRKSMHVQINRGGIEMLAARSQMLEQQACNALIQCSHIWMIRKALKQKCDRIGKWVLMVKVLLAPNKFALSMKPLHLRRRRLLTQRN